MNAAKSKALFKVDFYTDANGDKPAAVFLKKMGKSTVFEAIRMKLSQVKNQGLTNGAKPLSGPGAGIREFRLFDEGGHRIFFMDQDNGIVILGICIKANQAFELERCIGRRRDYKKAAKSAKQETKESPNLEVRIKAAIPYTLQPRFREAAFSSLRAMGARTPRRVDRQASTHTL
jgi:putative component of toxin-antitoxin plasmid stabilization module